MKILIGDDKEEVRTALARVLSARNLEAELASTPEETIAKARAGNYSAVVTDLEYTEKGREGYEVLRAIKDIPAKKILYTGVLGFEHVMEALLNGADHVVLGKNQEELLEILTKEEAK